MLKLAESSFESAMSESVTSGIGAKKNTTASRNLDSSLVEFRSLSSVQTYTKHATPRYTNCTDCKDCDSAGPVPTFAKMTLEARSGATTVPMA